MSTPTLQSPVPVFNLQFPLASVAAHKVCNTMSTPTLQVFNLQFPFEYRGAQYIEFKARRPRVRDLRNFIKNVDKDGVAAMEKVLADLCEVDEKIISEIDIEDFAPMKAWFEGFLKPMLNESTES
ncbi:hypothetical protein ABIF15_009499 [Bradyrhizobium elkanii]